MCLHTGKAIALPQENTVSILGQHLTNPGETSAEWVVHVPKGLAAAELMAQQNGLHVLGEVIPDSNEYHMRAMANGSSHSRNKRSSRRNEFYPHHIQKKILSHSDVRWAERQESKVRTKRDSFSNQNYSPFQHRSEAGASSVFNDPMYSKMWYITRKDQPNMNVEDAWAQGITGAGVSVTILDDGVEKDHPDLLTNYDPLASTDINDNDSDPHPRYDFSDSNRHGTRCAGQVAARANNSQCAVGIAYNARIGGIRMLDGQVSDAVEARSLSYNPGHIDIYSSSWGPNDDGKTVDGPGRLASRAFLNGITRGREGRGSIFVWASGNGGRYKDNCNCDGYATSIYTITVSSASESGNIPWYSEACSSTLATTYSSGTQSEKQIVTTDLHGACTARHTGTSASAPMAAGIIALALEANSQLTWRDVQHIIVKTAKPHNLKATDWKSNHLGRNISHSFGYGLMDSGAMVREAKDWTNMPKQSKCERHSPYYYKVIPAMGTITMELEVPDCADVNLLEHVIAKVHVSAGKKRGDLKIILTSPKGTRSTLLDVRPHDFTSSGFVDWPFMTVHSWGENPIGVWKLTIYNNAYSKWSSDAKFFKWSLVLHGVEYDPNTKEYKQRQRELKQLELKRQRELEERPLRRGISWPFGTNQTSDSTSLKGVGLRPRINDIVVGSSRISSIESSRPNSPRSKNVSIQWKSQNTNQSENLQSQNQLLGGCISKRLECTRTFTKCRTYTRRNVADLFCQCSEFCSEVSTFTNPQNGEDNFNLQCSLVEVTGSGLTALSIPSKQGTLPVWCKFIPFFSYT